MKRIAILTAGGDTPALNATIRARYMHPMLYDPKLMKPYHSINTDIHKRIRYLEMEAA